MFKKFDNLNPEEQVQTLLDRYHKEDGNKLKQLYENINKNKNQLHLIRGCLFVEVNLLRAEQAALEEYKLHNIDFFAQEYPDIIEKTDMYIENHSKCIEHLEKKIKVLKKLRADRRSLLKSLSSTFVIHFEHCLDIFDAPPSYRELIKIHNDIVSKCKAKNEPFETNDEWIKVKRLIQQIYPNGDNF